MSGEIGHNLHKIYMGHQFEQPLPWQAVHKRSATRWRKDGISHLLPAHANLREATLLLVSCVKHYAFYGSSRSSVPENHCSISTEQNCSLKHRKPQSRYIVTSLVDIATYTAGVEVSRSLFFLHDLRGSLAASLNRRINFVDISSRFMSIFVFLGSECLFRV